MKEARIFLIAEDAYVRGGIKSSLSAEPSFRVVGEAATPDEARTTEGSPSPSVIVVDTAGLGADLGRIVRRVRGGSGDTAHLPVVLLVADEAASAMDLLRLGACTVTRSRAGAADLVATIRLVSSGYLPVKQVVARRLVSGMPRNGTSWGDVRSRLTKREWEVFELIVQGMSNGEIAHSLTVAESTVKTYVQDILRKLGVRNRLEVVIYAYRSMTPALSRSGSLS